MKVKGQLEDAQLEISDVAPTKRGQLKYGLTDSRIKVNTDNASTVKEVAWVGDIPSEITDLGILDGTNGQILTTNGSGNFVFTNISLTNVADGEITKEKIDPSVFEAPKVMNLSNPDFETDTTGWTFTGNGLISLNTTNPLSGASDLQVTSNAQYISGDGQSTTAQVKAGDKIEFDFTLENEVEKGQKINASFDLVIDSLLTVDDGYNFVVEVYDVDTATTLGDLALLNAESNTSGPVNDIAKKYNVGVEFTALNSTSVNYRLIIYSLNVNYV